MTLVVARRINQDISLIADSLSSDPKQILQSPLAGVLKIIILSPTTAIAFSGSIALAETAITRSRRVVSNLNDHTALTNFFLTEHMQMNQETDFIVCTLEPAACISRISGGELHADVLAAYIGNSAAFSAFQHVPKSTHDWSHIDHDRQQFVALTHQQSCAMSEIISSRQFNDVGGFQIRVASKGRAFRYWQSSYMELRTETFDATPTLLGASTAQAGAYSASVLTSDLPFPIVGVHFHEPSFGVVFDWSDGHQVSRILQVTHMQFVDEVQRRFGVTLQGLRFGP
jgi:hypothetical protein